MAGAQQAIVIRKLRTRELAALQDAMPFGVGGKHVDRLARQSRDEATYLIAWDGARPVGHGLLKWRPVHEIPQLRELTGCPDLEDLLIHPDWRGRGIGTALIERALELARRRGFTQFGLSVGATDNPRARALYERLGFRDVGLGPIEEGSDYIDAAGQPASWREICVYLIKPLTPSRPPPPRQRGGRPGRSRL